ncbi:MAG: AAA family ATPase [Verrucomicrobia bacterium]|nr:AAA family ATPase [Verrucomicrobiota bacterium]
MTSSRLPRKSPPSTSTEKGLLYDLKLPDEHFDDLWEAVIVEPSIKARLLSQAVLNFTLRPKINPAEVPLHGVILMEGPPGTGKTSLARGLASRVADILSINTMHYLEVEPHGLASGQLGRSQQAVRNLLSGVVAERATAGPLIVVLDEVETLAADRQRLSLEANPVDVHRATDAVLAQLDHLALQHTNILIIATSNFPQAIDRAFLSRSDLVMHIGLPNAEACSGIVRDTLRGLAKAVPKLTSLADSKEIETFGRLCEGMDGRRIRKAVTSALALSKELALAPEKLTLHEVREALRLAHANLKMEIKK